MSTFMHYQYFALIQWVGRLFELEHLLRGDGHAKALKRLK